MDIRPAPRLLLTAQLQLQSSERLLRNASPGFINMKSSMSRLFVYSSIGEGGHSIAFSGCYFEVVGFGRSDCPILWGGRSFRCSLNAAKFRRLGICSVKSGTSTPRFLREGAGPCRMQQQRQKNGAPAWSANGICWERDELDCHSRNRGGLQGWIVSLPCGIHFSGTHRLFFTGIQHFILTAAGISIHCGLTIRNVTLWQ